jgi:hypothetical protein
MAPSATEGTDGACGADACGVTFLVCFANGSIPKQADTLLESKTQVGRTLRNGMVSKIGFMPAKCRVDEPAPAPPARLIKSAPDATSCSE